MTTAARIDTARAAELFHALSDQIRMDVVVLLMDGERCVCDLMTDLRPARDAQTKSEGGCSVGMLRLTGFFL